MLKNVEEPIQVFNDNIDDVKEYCERHGQYVFNYNENTRDGCVGDTQACHKFHYSNFILFICSKPIILTEQEYTTYIQEDPVTENRILHTKIDTMDQLIEFVFELLNQ